MPLSKQYVREVSAVPRVSRDEETELAIRYKAGDLKAGQQLVAANLKFVWHIAHKYDSMGFEFEDLVQEGNIGLLVAAEKFNPSRGYKFITYAVWWVQAYIKNYTIKNWSLVKMGTTAAQRKLFFGLRKQRNQNRDDKEIAEVLDVSVGDVEEMSLRLAAKDFSLNARVGRGDTGDGSRTQRLDLLESDNQDIDETVDRKMVRESVRAKIAELALNERQKFIVEHRLLAEDPMTLDQVGERLGGLSREWMRQTEIQVIKKIKEALS